MQFENNSEKAIIIGGTTGLGKKLANILLANNYRIAVTGIEKDIIDNLQYS